MAGLLASLGEPSQWAATACEYMEPWPGQFCGNIVHYGPTEASLAAIAPLAGHADALDELLDTALDICDRTGATLSAMYTRLYGACGLRIRNGAGDRERADRLVAEAIERGDSMGAGIARLAAQNWPALRDLTV
jgi:hypothetical protein